MKEKRAPSAHFRFGVGMLLLLYAAVYSFSPGLLPHVHHDHELHQGDSCLKDACHIAIYHPGGEGGCDHKAHFTCTEAECRLCHFTLARHLRLPEVTSMNIASVKLFIQPSHIFYVPDRPLIDHADRGPPSPEHLS